MTRDLGLYVSNLVFFINVCVEDTLIFRNCAENSSDRYLFGSEGT